MPVRQPLVTERFLNEVLLIAELRWELLSPLCLSPAAPFPSLLLSYCNYFTFSMTASSFTALSLSLSLSSSCHFSLSQNLFIFNLSLCFASQCPEVVFTLWVLCQCFSPAALTHRVTGKYWFFFFNRNLLYILSNPCVHVYAALATHKLVKLGFSFV